MLDRQSKLSSSESCSIRDGPDLFLFLAGDRIPGLISGKDLPAIRHIPRYRTGLVGEHDDDVQPVRLPRGGRRR